MTINRSQSREIIMTILYQISLFKQNNTPYEIDDVIENNLEVDNEFVKEVVFGVITHEENISNVANKYLKDWSIERLGKTGAAILKIALYEIKYLDTPPIVAINEAIELAKKFTDDNVRKMINAVLDKVVNE